MGIKHILMITALLATSTISIAESSDWVKLNENEAGSLYAMPQSISKDELGNKLIWLKAVYHEPRNRVKSFKSLYVFDCDIKKQGISHSIEYDKNERVINEESIPSVMAPVHTLNPDGFSYKLMQSMCK
ncbi:surface-adhesin E family protein [Psychrobacter sp. T6-6]|uniref:surface-adhesin E family protein n=1 Tax=Psychrobacter sp. T6-6 TaxID=3457452 RepID=UPI003FD230AF